MNKKTIAMIATCLVVPGGAIGLAYMAFKHPKTKELINKILDKS